MDLYKLIETQTDGCLNASQKTTAVCLQELIANVTNIPPEFPHILTELRFSRYPWDRPDPNKVNPGIAEEYWKAYNETESFHESGANCAISKYVCTFGKCYRASKYAAQWTTVAAIPLLFSVGAIMQYTIGSPEPGRPSLFGFKELEYMFISAIWISYQIGVVMLAVSQEYYF